MLKEIAINLLIIGTNKIAKFLVLNLIKQVIIGYYSRKYFELKLLFLCNLTITILIQK